MTDNTGSEHHDRGRDTRARLRELSLQLFAEQGYEKTSLREIAEHLGVTKAALYYYFKSKEDIVRSLVEDYVADLDELIAWGKTQPRTAAVRAEIIRRGQPGDREGTRRGLPGADGCAHRPADRARGAAARPGQGCVIADQHQLLL